MNRAQRISIGIAAVLFLGVGAVGAMADLDPGWPPILLRGGIILSAVWFAAPTFRNVSRRVWIGVAVVGTVLALRPRLILWGLAAGLIFAFLVGRSRDAHEKTND